MRVFLVTSVAPRRDGIPTPAEAGVEAAPSRCRPPVTSLRSLFVTALALLPLIAACGPGLGAGAEDPRGAPAASRPVAEFPAVARVEVALTGEPPDLAPLVARGDVVHVDEWVVESAPAPGDPVYEPGDDPFEALVDAVAAERGIAVRRSASLRCAAEEYARFYARHEAMPTERLWRFILAACGASGLEVHRAGRLASIPDSVPLAQLAARSAEPMREMIGRVLDPERLHGLAVVREAGKVALMVLSARPAGVFVPWGPPNEVGEVHLAGRIATPGDVLIAFVNQGPFGVVPCRVEPMVRVPDFDLRCPMAAGDETAFVNLQMLTVGRVLARRAAVIMLRRDGARPTFRAPSGASADAGDAAALLAHLNEVRAQAGLAPLTASAPESAVHMRAAPYAAAATIQSQADTQELLSLGLMAGWQVQGGTIRSAEHLTSVEIGTRSPAQWVAAAIEQPVGRLLLLRPDSRQAAIGTVSVEDPPALAAVVSTYSFFEGTDHAADADRLFARVERERTARGLPPPRRMQGLDVLSAQARRVTEGAQPAASLRIALDQESTRRRQSLRGMQLEAVDLDHAQLPDELFARRDLTLGLAVGHTRAPGAAWGQYVVFFVFPG